MINIAIVEDNDSAANLMIEFLEKYSKEKNVQFNIKRFCDAINFLSEFRKVYDIIFMDIEMPGLNGMDAAFKIRKVDKQVVLIFVTNMAHFAVKGYEVDALDFMIKPITYHNLVLIVNKSLKILKTNDNIDIIIFKADGFTRVPSNKVIYIEVIGHKLHYHTDEEIIIASGSLTELEGRLKQCNFMRCNNCYLVNPKYIKSVKGLIVLMQNGDKLSISHPKKKKFLTELADWMGQGNFV